MSDLFRRYPQLQKACEEKKNYHTGMGLSVPPGAEAAVLRCAEIIDQCIDRPPAEKEALMVMATLFTGVKEDFIFSDKDRFKKEYSPQVQNLVDAFTPDGIATPQLMGNKDYRQYMAAHQLAGDEHLLTFLKEGNMKKADIERLKNFRWQTEREKEDLTALSPRLQELHEKTDKELRREVDRILKDNRPHNRLARKMHLKK